MRGGREEGMCKFNFLFSVAQCLARRAMGADGLLACLQVRKEVVLP
jgi:hypothetical protein